MKMKLKDFSETFKEDLLNQEFTLGYLQDCLEEGGISLFISALKDIIEVHQKTLLNNQEYQNKQILFKEFLSSEDPTFSIVYQVIQSLGIQWNLQLECVRK